MSEPELSQTPSPVGLDSLATVREHPGWFFQGGAFDSEDALVMLAAEAIRGGATCIEVRREGPWIEMGADVDWLSGDLRPFFALVPYPEAGRNASRTEVVLTAFCLAVLTGTSDGVDEVASSRDAILLTPPPELTLNKSGRSVLFLPPGAPTPSTVDGAAEQRTSGLRLVQGEGERRMESAVSGFEDKMASGKMSRA